MSASTYDPRYVNSLDDVPISGPDTYGMTEKLQAIRAAESKLEGDVNAGFAIENPGPLHAHAAEAYASYILVGGSKTPDSATMGDMADEGSDRMDVTHEFLAMYREAVSAIEQDFFFF